MEEMGNPRGIWEPKFNKLRAKSLSGLRLRALIIGGMLKETGSRKVHW